MGAFRIESGAFGDGGTIPAKYGYKHGNCSPPLRITGTPEAAASTALIMDDPDAVGAVGRVWVHWVVCNMGRDPVFGENSPPKGCVEGVTDFGTPGYGGPAPPDREHTYVFRAFALDAALDAAPGLDRGGLERMMEGHVLAEARLEGRYAPQ